MKQEVFVALCHPDPRLAGLVSGSDPSTQVARCRNKASKLRVGMTCWIAFTLAEVLITLGIIGVVAAITMPGLVKDYQSKVYSTANMVFENRLGEAMRQMNIADDLTGLASTEEFVEKLKKYMKIIKTCEPNDLTPCFADKISVQDGNSFEIKNLSSHDTFVGAKEWGTQIHGIVLQNGHSVLIQYNPSCQTSGITAKAEELLSGTCVAKIYDTNGKSHPNTYNKDIAGNMVGKPFLVKLPGGLWMTAGDVSYSPIGKDYWAGAVKACSNLGMSLPSSDASGIAEYSCKDSGANQNSEACQMYNYCREKGTCSADVYWLKEASTYAGAPSSYGLVLSYSYAGGQRQGDVMCNWYRDRDAVLSNDIVPAVRCVSGP